MDSTSPDSSAEAEVGDPGEAAPGGPASGEAGTAGAPGRPAIYFDGVTNRRHVVALRFGATLDIIEDGTTLGAWSYADLRT
ncbi:MAG TPA: metalloendopeptidase, partial [Methyloceanibacter sp.]|nr:metalloendopeptidase [Methyloceanibacter sp.]